MEFTQKWAIFFSIFLYKCLSCDFFKQTQEQDSALSASLLSPAWPLPSRKSCAHTPCQVPHVDGCVCRVFLTRGALQAHMHRDGGSSSFSELLLLPMGSPDAACLGSVRPALGSAPVLGSGCGVWGGPRSPGQRTQREHRAATPCGGCAGECLSLGEGGEGQGWTGPVPSLDASEALETVPGPWPPAAF